VENVDEMSHKRSLAKTNDIDRLDIESSTEDSDDYKTQDVTTPDDVR
jgi:hypothetical protein